MEVKKKGLYEVPSITVMDVKTEGIVCNSNLHVMWLLDGNTLSSTQDWDRSGYGDAVDIL